MVKDGIKRRLWHPNFGFDEYFLIQKLEWPTDFGDQSFIRSWNDERQLTFMPPWPASAYWLKQWMRSALQLSKHPPLGHLILKWSLKDWESIPDSHQHTVTIIEGFPSCTVHKTVLDDRPGFHINCYHFPFLQAKFIAFRSILEDYPWTKTKMSDSSTSLNEKSVETLQGSLNSPWRVNQICLSSLFKSKWPWMTAWYLKTALKIRHMVLPNS